MHNQAESETAPFNKTNTLSKDTHVQEEILFVQQTSREPGVLIEQKRANQRSCLSSLHHYGDVHTLAYINAAASTDSTKCNERKEDKMFKLTRLLVIHLT